MRRSISKKTRFEIFKRDGFVCQYCGASPPNAILEIDHINPVSKGGSNDILNLITSCQDCNQGKGARKLGNISPRPDADLEWLEAQQEIAELRRYQIAKNERDKLISEIVENLADQFMIDSGYSWHPDKIEAGINKMLRSKSPDEIEEALSISARKITDGSIDRYDWERYTWGIIRTKERE